MQVVKNAKQTQARKANKAGGYADDDAKPAEEPKRWSDYTVSSCCACCAKHTLTAGQASLQIARHGWQRFCKPKACIDACLRAICRTVLQTSRNLGCAVQVRFEFPEPSELPSSSLLQLIDADFKYPDRDDFGLQGLNIGIDMGSRVAIVGPNGAGKTTLMNLLAGGHMHSCFIF